MSARGARSRKVQQKDIDKKEKKVAVKGKSSEAHDGFADWHATPPSSNGSRGVGLSRSVSNLSQGTSHSSGSGNRQRVNTVYSNHSSGHGRPVKSPTGGAASVSDQSTKSQDKAKFQANGKETKAPRGRGGGVPLKSAGVAHPQFRSETPAPPLPSHKKTWLGFKVWGGKRQEMRPYGGFAFDEDMHNGSVLIYFKEEQMDDSQPVPSLRAELDILRNSGSTWINNALMMGRLDGDEDDWRSSAIEEFMIPVQPNAYGKRLLTPTSLGGLSPPPLDIDKAPPRSASRTPQGHSYAGRSTPSSLRSQQYYQQNPTHEVWFTAPAELRTLQAQRLHHVAIRNFLAILHNKPLVGADIFDMLNTLQSQIQVMYGLDPNSRLATPAERSAPMITEYLSKCGIDDVRNDTNHALSLLAWAEQDCVRWRAGYLECFVHLVGAMTPQTEEIPEFKRLSVVTRRNLGIATKTLQLRVMEAEERLAAFDLTDLWEGHGKLVQGPVYQSYQAFRQFLINHYGAIYGSWPPPAQNSWLTRRMIVAMQNDFGSLYDYLVDRDVHWNPREERASRKWEMQHRRTDHFEADLPELGITDLLVTFDAKAGYAHIPHPYPLLPKEVSGIVKEKEKKGFFASLKKDKQKDSAKDAKAHLQLSIVFSDATNIEKLDANFSGSSLIDKFEQFELTTDLKTMTPRESRLGRWVLLYGILQILSTLSVDVQGLKHTEGVRYFLCTDLKRCPDWVTHGQASVFEPSQQRSWCWQRSWDPSPIQILPVELDAAATSSMQMAPQPRSRSNTQERSNEYMQGASSPPSRPLPLAPLDLGSPLDLEGTTLVQDDIARIQEKINALTMDAHTSRSPRHEYERRRENEKAMSARVNDVGMDYHHLRSEKTYSPIEDEPPTRSVPRPASRSDKERREKEREVYSTQPLPSLPPRSPLRLSDANTDLGGYPFSVAEMGFPSPPGYAMGAQGRPGSRATGGLSRERSGGKPPRYEERSLRREGEVDGRAGWM